MKFKKILGYILYNFFAIYLPESSTPLIGNISRKLRATCANLILEKCGVNINIEKGAKFSHRIEIGDNSGIGVNARINGKVIIGENVMMGPNCVIYTINHKHDRTDIPMCKQGVEEEKVVRIGSDVWIGTNTIILPGVQIGNGVIIAAGTVVNKSIPPYKIVASSRLKIIKDRKRDNDIRKC